MGIVIARRAWLISGAIALALVLVLAGTATGRNALAWVYLQYADVVTRATHIHAFSLDRLESTCPQCL